MSTQGAVSVSSSSGYSADDWLAQDHDIQTPIFLRVEPGATMSAEPRWSIAWLVGGKEPSEEDMTAIRYVAALETPDCLIDLPESLRWACKGPMTRPLPDSSGAKLYTLAKMDRKARQEIVRLANTTFLTGTESSVSGGHGSRAWAMALLSAMVSANLLQEEAAQAFVQTSQRL
ncbi:hypothetical protein PYCCODRAFT_332252 [Trametes coccinea BRFM310]|uniref:Uncharacterized protein n=1 Tax=Trametes coccinea (strain BRFM310) TaxID=1353009 RepID=A0A1Y2INI1_TRAC3|nr:hypothetical protein PYCCODRAFT_332252 [Trametes coccinea BRFM310]